MKTFVKLNKNEMKMVMGGVEEEMLESGVGSCRVTVICVGGSIECSSDHGLCLRHADTAGTEGGWVQCDADPKIYCDN